VILEHVFNFFDRFPHDNTSFWLIWLSILLYQNRLFMRIFMFFRLYFMLNWASSLGSKAQDTLSTLALQL